MIEKEIFVGMKIFDSIEGWGEITFETEHYFIVRWDRDPNSYTQFPKGV